MTVQMTRYEEEWDALEGRFGLRVAQALDEITARPASAEVTERLRFARERALAEAGRRRSLVHAAEAVAVGPGGLLSLRKPGGPASGWGWRVAMVAPLLVLVAGMVGISDIQERARIQATAEVDSALLADDLPPDAYSDPGFVEFLTERRR